MNAFDCCIRSKDYYIDDSQTPKKSTNTITSSSLPSPPTIQSANMTTDQQQHQQQKEKVSTFARQSELPRLPIPSLEETLTSFQSTLEPLLSATEYTQAKRDIQTFRSNESEGPKLHSLLLEYEAQNVSSHTVGSYIEEFWSEAYLSPNTSVVLNLNPYFLLENDPNLVKQSQIPRAASLCFNSLKFAHSIKNETLTPETFKSNPICMDQFRSLLGSTRIPKLDEADVVEVDPHSTHVAVLYRHEFYFFTALWPHDHPSHPNAVAVSEAEIAHILKNIVEDGKQTPLHDTTCSSALGVLTTLPRMQWARARENLASSSAHNKTTLEILDSALFCLVLDDYIPSTVHHAAANLLHGTTELKVNAELGVEYQVGTCCNRWYDKLQLIVCGDGSAGVNFEHSAIDGHTALRFASDVFAETLVSFAKSITKSIYPKGECPISNVLESTVVLASFMEDGHGGGLDTNPKKLTWDDVPGIQKQIYHAETKLGDSISADDTHVLEFEDFGKNLIVRNKMSPDALVQMSILLAYYKLYGEIVNQYEPVLTKQFFHGRTEAMRSTTAQTVSLCKIWTDASSTTEQKLEALRVAVKNHGTLVRQALQGKGVDRHLYALKCIAEKRNVDMPPFFSSPAWNALNHTVLSTSNCGNPALRLFGFGPVVNDGFGIGYIIKEDGIQYSISSKHRQTGRYANVLEGTLREIGAMLQPLNHQRLGYHRTEKKKGANYLVGFDFFGESKIKDKRKRLLEKSAGDSSFVGRSYRRQTSVDSEALSSVGTKIKR